MHCDNVPTENSSNHDASVGPFKDSSNLLRDANNMLFSAMAIHKNYDGAPEHLTEDGRPEHLTEVHAEQLEGARRNYVRLLQKYPEYIGEETGGITKEHFRIIANIAERGDWRRRRDVTMLQVMLNQMGVIKNEMPRCKTCRRFDDRSRLFYDIFHPAIEALRLHSQGAESKDKFLQLQRKFKSGLSTTIQDPDRYKGLVDKEAIYQLHDLGHAADWSRPEEVGAIYRHGCTLFGRPPREFTRKK